MQTVDAKLAQIYAVHRGTWFIEIFTKWHHSFLTKKNNSSPYKCKQDP